jgi:glycosyltransferase involved in cell wall biosynthesis
VIRRKKILFIINSLEFFVTHRLNIALELHKKNYKIDFITDFNEIPKELKNCSFKKINFKISNFNIVKIFLSFLTFTKHIKLYEDYVIHAITIKAIFYTIISTLFLKDKNIKFVLSFTGLGYLFINKNLFTFLIKFIFFILLRNFIKKNNYHLIFQNLDDYNYIYSKVKFDKSKISLIKGSGVNLNYFNYSKQKITTKINFTFISRLLYDKGIKEFMDASNLILKKKIDASFTIIGDIYKDNPKSINEKLVLNWSNNKDKFYLGYKSNIRDYIINSNVIVLPSYREGMPKILIEASALGRPIITTDVPGCRECVIHNLNGYLIKSKNVSDLVNAIIKIVKDPNILIKMGKESRIIAEKNYDINYVVDKHLMIYEQ